MEKIYANYLNLQCFIEIYRASVSNEQSIIRLIGAILLEQNDEWQLQSRYMQVEAMAELNTQPNEAQPAQIPPRAA